MDNTGDHRAPPQRAPGPARPTFTPPRARVASQQQRPTSAPVYRSRTSPPKPLLAPRISPVKERPPAWIGAFELKVQVTGLPPSYGTLELYKTFCHLGNLVRIEVESSNDAGTRGWLFFRPAPAQDSKQLRRFEIRDSTNTTYHVSCKTWAQEPYQRVSPSHESIKFPEIITVPFTKFDIGAMAEPDHILVLQTIQQADALPLELQLDLRLQALDVVFGIIMPSEQGQTSQVQRFKIRVSLAQLRQLKKKSCPDGEVVLCVTLDLPPKLFRKASNIEATHESGSWKWYEDQTWYRQTGIYYPRNARNIVTKLRQESAMYDIGRWLSFALTIDGGTARSKAFNTMDQTLIDHNVDITQTAVMKFTAGDPEHLWDWLSIQREVDNSSASASLLNDLDFDVQYQLEVCLSQGVLHECTLTHGWVQQLASLGTIRAIKILEKAAADRQRYYDPMQIFRLQTQVSVLQKAIPKYCAMMRSAVVTSSTIYLATPTLETSNRVFRRYKQHEDRFLRVKFSDEKYVGRIMASGDNTKDELLTRVKRTMTNGIQIGDRHYDFLAFGNSQFREAGAYFFASTGDLTAETIRSKMGDFTKIRTVAKYASRIGQCFSTTRAMKLGVKASGIVDVDRNGFCFTDGVGKISPFLAQMIAEELGLPSPLTGYPSVFQFRLGGSKGVLAVDPSLKGKEVQLRPSQEKFPAEFHGLEICRISQFSSAYLNMQVILVLDALGVPPSVFVQKMRETLRHLEEAMINSKRATEQLLKKVDFNQTTITLALMIEDGFMVIQEPFMMSCLYNWRSWMIKYLKEKARIFVDDGAFVLGCIDETATLKGHVDNDQRSLVDKGENDLPEIFIQIPDPEVRSKYRVIEGTCILTRNPCLHPGDIRVVRAVDVVQLRHLKDCVVLPQNGDRDLANMCAGGDLDGDDYLVIWDHALLPEEWNHPPMVYRAPPPVISHGPVTVDDMTSFFVTHMKNDNLGRLAVAHRYWADQLPDSVKDERCIELARLNSMAVDYAKTGVPAEMPKQLRVSRWPHWSEVKKKGEKGWYESKKVLGLLYDEVERVEFEEAAWSLPFDQRVLAAYETDEDMRARARDVKQHYDEAVRRVMAQYGIKSEFEIWTTFALERSQGLSDYKLAESLGETVQALKQYHQEMCYEQAGTTAKERDWQKMAPFIVAMYTVTAEEISAAVSRCEQQKRMDNRMPPGQKMAFDNMPFMSFPWIFARELGQIANNRSAPMHAQSTTWTGSKIAPKKDVGVFECEAELEPLQVINEVDGMKSLHGGEVLDLFHQQDTRMQAKTGEAKVRLRSASSRPPGHEQPQAASTAMPESTPMTKGCENVKRNSCRDEGLQHGVVTGEVDQVPEEVGAMEEVVISMGDKPSALGAMEKLLEYDS